MSKSLVIDSVELIPGALVIGETGHGCLGSAIPDSGTHGPAYAYDSVSLQSGFANKEYRGVLGPLPAGLIVQAFESTAFTASAPDGSYIVPWSLYEDGLLVGTTSFTLVFG